MTAVSRPGNLFEGIRPAQYRESLRDFPELAGKVEQRTAGMSQDEIEAGHRERTAQMIRLAELLAADAPADDDAVLAEIDGQYRALTELRAVSAEEYRAIGRSCVENAQWRAAYEAIAPGPAAYQRDAIEGTPRPGFAEPGVRPPRKSTRGGGTWAHAHAATASSRFDVSHGRGTAPPARTGFRSTGIRSSAAGHALRP